MVGPARLERATCGLGNRRSIHLSYGPVTRTADCKGSSGRAVQAPLLRGRRRERVAEQEPLSVSDAEPLQLGEVVL